MVEIIQQQELMDLTDVITLPFDLSTGLSPSPMTTTVFKSETTELTASEFCRGVKRDKSHYMELQDDKYIHSWNRSFVATAFMHHTQHVLDADYKPVTASEIGLVKEMQIFMHAVFEDKKVNQWLVTTKLHVMLN
jgi:hypothetical protein